MKEFKNKIGIVKQVDLKFITTESWLGVRKKVKESKCENCNKLHSEEEFLTLATVEGRVNAHLCNSCGQSFIDRGAVDIQKLKIKNVNLRDKLIKQAKRVGVRFSFYYGLKEDKATIEELKKAISNSIKEERKQFKTFLDLSPEIHYKIKLVTDETNKVYNTNYSYYSTWLDSSDIFSSYSSHENYDHHRWISYFDATQRIGDLTLEYRYATCNGDNSIEDNGFDVFDVWGDLQIREFKIEFTDTQRLDWLSNNLEKIVDIKENLERFY